MDRKNILLTFLAVLLFYFLLILSGCASDNAVLQDPVDPEEIVEAEAELEPEEIADEPDPEPESSESVETSVIIEQWQPMRLIIPAINLTTNLEFSKWVHVFYDEQMTTAMIDRLVHHGYLLIFDGQSYRIRNSLMKTEV